MSSPLEAMKGLGYYPILEDPQLYRALGVSFGVTTAGYGLYRFQGGLSGRLAFYAVALQTVALLITIVHQWATEKAIIKGTAVEAVYDLMTKLRGALANGIATVYSGQSVNPERREEQHLKDGAMPAWTRGKNGQINIHRKAEWAGHCSMRVVRLLPTAASKDRCERRRIWALSWWAIQMQRVGINRFVGNIEFTVPNVKLKGKREHAYLILFALWYGWLGVLWPRRFSYGLLKPFADHAVFEVKMEEQITANPWFVPGLRAMKA